MLCIIKSCLFLGTKEAIFALFFFKKGILNGSFSAYIVRVMSSFRYARILGPFFIYSAAHITKLAIHQDMP